jgi:phage baseplate assembly protein W
MATNENGKRIAQRGWAFPVTFNAAGPVMSKTDLVDIAQNLKHLMGTLPGERIMRPQFGCDWLAILFKNLTDDLRAEIRTIVTEAIMRNEPRVVVEEVVVSQSREQVDRVHVSVMYRVAGRDVVRELAVTAAPN